MPTIPEHAQILAAYDALKADLVAWADYMAELAEWDVTTADFGQSPPQ